MTTTISLPMILSGEIQDPEEIRSAILALEESARGLEQSHYDLKHTFAPGAYAREITIPAGEVVVGKIHRHAHLNIVSRGLVTVRTEFGLMTIDARDKPVTFTSEPGTKRALYVHVECTWTTIHLTNETDLAKIESEIIAPSYADLKAIEKNA